MRCFNSLPFFRGLRFFARHGDVELAGLLEDSAPPADLCRIGIFRSSIAKHDKQARCSQRVRSSHFELLYISIELPHISMVQVEDDKVRAADQPLASIIVALHRMINHQPCRLSTVCKALSLCRLLVSYQIVPRIAARMAELTMNQTETQVEEDLDAMGAYVKRAQEDANRQVCCSNALHPQ